MMLKDNYRYNENVKANSAFVEELFAKIPEYFTGDGQFDIEKLRSNLRESNVDELSAGYQLEWIGKDYAKKTAGEMPRTVIVPDIKHNELDKNQHSRNMFFAGDNIEVLRHLQAVYTATVDFIYIDPPYNTGSDGFVYPDSFEYSDAQMIDMFGLTDDQLIRLKSIQGRSTHSAWLTFMYPRLYLAKKLLKDTGIIFVSIDDNEQANLREIMDEIFGEASFVGNIAWESKTKSQNTTTAYDKLQPKVEHIFVYEKMDHRHFNLTVSGQKEYPFEDDKGKYREYELEEMAADGIRGRSTMIFEILGISPSAGNQWKLGREKISKYLEDDELFVRDSKIVIKIRPENESSEKYNPFWAFFPKEIGTAESAKSELNKLMGVRELFDTVKPMDLIKQLIYQGAPKDATVMDFFAGSGTTAEAVLRLNVEDGGSRQYIVATLDEPTFNLTPDGERVAAKGAEAAFAAGYDRIDQITFDRIQKAIGKILEQNPTTEIDLGFKHYRVVEPTQKALEEIENFSDVEMQSDLFDNMVTRFSADELGVEGGATGEETLLTTSMVEDGYDFSTEIVVKDFAGYPASYVDEARLYLFETGWGAEQTRQLVNEIGTHELNLQTVVVYGYSFSMESIRELEIAVNQLDSKVNLLVRY